MIFNFIPIITSAVSFVFSSQSLIASALRFVAGTIISQLLAGEQKSEGPRLSDLKVQVSSYGNPLPRLYGQVVRVASNIIDKSDLIETRKKKKKKMLGITVASNTTYTYAVHLACALCDGELPANGLRKVRANGKVIFDRDAPEATPPTNLGLAFLMGALFGRTNKTQAKFESLTFYPGSATQDPDPTLEALHPGENVPAYRHTAYVVIKGLQLADWGNGIPNLEFEVETHDTSVGLAVHKIAQFADVDMIATRLYSIPLRGYIVAKAGAVWSALEPLSGAFSFDVLTNGADLRVRRRGNSFRCTLRTEDFAARAAKDGGTSEPIDLQRTDGNNYPDEVTVTYNDVDRDHQVNTQRAGRNAGYGKNKVDVEVALNLTADEARQMAARILSETLAAAGSVRLHLDQRLRFLNASDMIGVPVDGSIFAFRIGEVIESPNGVLVVSGAFDDGLSYTQTIAGATGTIPPNELELPGDTIWQPMDASILEDADNDTGFYFATTGTGLGWVGGDIYRADGVGSPLTYEFVTDIIVPACIADCTTTLASGPTDVVDWINTLEVLVLGGDPPESSSEEGVLVRNENLAWVGAPDGQGGEYINFITATPGGSPLTYTLSGLLRGRRGTEHAVASHGSGERFVIADTAEIGRFDFGPSDWNVARTYRAVSIPMDPDDGLTTEFTNTGEGKRPYAPVHLAGVRNDANDDVLITWERRTRMETPLMGGGPVPLGEATELYSIDIYSGVSVVRTLTATTTSVNYTEAMQTADSHSLGAPVVCAVYQVSDVRGRGHAVEGTV